jgi:YVTN family beta-propeller protein
MRKILFLLLLSGTVVQAEKTAFVINGLAETLSRIDLKTGDVFNDVVSLGKTPNQIVIQGDRGYVVNSGSKSIPGSNTIQIVDLAGDSILGTIALGDSNNPWNIAFYNDSIAYVTNYESHRVFRINVAAREVTDTIPVGLSPEGLCVVGNRVYVTNTACDPVTYAYGQGTVYVIDVTSNTVTDSILVSTNPQAVALDPDGELNVVCTGDYWSIWGEILVIDTVTLSVTDSIDIGGSPTGITIASNGRAYIGAGGWVSEGYVYTYDTHTNGILRGSDSAIVVGIGVMGIACDQDNNAHICAFMSDSISVIDSTDASVCAYGVGDGPQSIAIYCEEVGTETGQIGRVTCELMGSSPNPFNRATEIRYGISHRSQVSISIYDLSGSLVRTLVSCRQEPGVHSITWNGGANDGNKVRGGVYFCQMKVGGSTRTEKLLILR